jgi:limonene-1,2-epoxide hydrolase
VPRESVEVVLGFVEALNDVSVERAVERLDARVVWHHNVGVGTPLEGVYHGRDAVRRMLGSIVELFDGFVLAVEDVQADDGRVEVSGMVRVRGAGSGVSVATPFHSSSVVRDGFVVEQHFRQG